ncbi:MAG: hypothetical protein OHK0022_30920 [Roseiflexaceae bacterium]
MLIDDEDYQGRKHDRALRERLARYSRLLEQTPDDHKLWNDRAIARAKLGDAEGALADYTRALELSPEQDQPHILYNRSKVHRDASNLAAALADLDAALALRPELVDALITRAGVHEQLGDTERALADLGAALALDPNNTLTLNNRAYLCLRHGRFEQALADLRAALALEPRYLTALCSLAETYIAMGEHEQGLDWLERAITLYPGVRDLARKSPDYDAVRGLPRFQELLAVRPARRSARLVAMPSVDLEAVRLMAVDAHWQLRSEQPASGDAPYTLVWDAAGTDTTITYREAQDGGPLARSFTVEGEDVEGVVIALHTALDLYTEGELRRLSPSSEF